MYVSCIIILYHHHVSNVLHCFIQFKPIIHVMLLKVAAHSSQ